MEDLCVNKSLDGTFFDQFHEVNSFSLPFSLARSRANSLSSMALGSELV
jgi:hypothetical protein